MNHDLYALAEAKCAAILQAHPWMAPEALHDKLLQIRHGSGSFESKTQKFIRIADRFHKAVWPQTACGSRCSACCHLPTMIYGHEAAAIAKASGRTASLPASRPRNKAMADAKKYQGLPCPFLKEHRCSVYEVRPIVCRLHHSLGSSPEACNTDLPIEQRQVPAFDVDLIESPFHAFMQSEAPTEPWGCIHEFFPAHG